jgi:hypothetical protein
MLNYATAFAGLSIIQHHVAQDIYTKGIDSQGFSEINLDTTQWEVRNAFNEAAKRVTPLCTTYVGLRGEKTILRMMFSMKDRQTWVDPFALMLLGVTASAKHPAHLLRGTKKHHPRHQLPYSLFLAQ